jgi:hypothetical protein
MKIIKKLSYMLLIFTSGLNHMFAMIEPQNSLQEGASHYSAMEHEIYVRNEGKFIKEIFDSNFSKTEIKKEGAYNRILTACAEKRRIIADICVRRGATYNIIKTFITPKFQFIFNNQSIQLRYENKFIVSKCPIKSA